MEIIDKIMQSYVLPFLYVVIYIWFFLFGFWDGQKEIDHKRDSWRRK